MTADEYLQKILDEQTFESDAPELETLRERIEAVKGVLCSAFKDSNPSLRQAGSLAKDTMIKESYDGDVACYFPHEDSEPGTSLQAIRQSVRQALEADYYVVEKPSALRIKDKSAEAFGTDFHIDVVPGRYVDEHKSDVHLYQNGTGKAYLKTNLQVHVDHVKKSGVRSAIRLGKLWNVRNGIGAKTFILELLIIKLLEEKQSASLSEQLTHVWTELRDHAADLSVEDPANPTGNDLKPALDACRGNLSAVAAATLSQIQVSGWESVFGPVSDDDDNGPDGGNEKKKAGFASAAAAIRRPTRPWSRR